MRLVRLQCKNCGYDLRSHRGQQACPECGSPISATINTLHRLRCRQRQLETLWWYVGRCAALYCLMQVGMFLLVMLLSAPRLAYAWTEANPFVTVLYCIASLAIVAAKLRQMPLELAISIVASVGALGTTCYWLLGSIFGSM